MANTVGEVITSGYYEYTITKAATATGSADANRGEVNAKLRSAYADQTTISNSIATYVTQNNYYYNVTGAVRCYAGFNKLISVPPIPETITNIEQMFYYCSSLSGNITFNTTSLISYSNAFAGTSNAIFIIPGSGADTINLRNMAAPYGNVHYSTEDNPKPNIESVSMIRVAANNSTTEVSDGKWIYIVANIRTYVTYLPSNQKTNGLQRVTVELDEEDSITQTFSADSSTDKTTTVVFWIETADETERHVVSIIARDSKNKDSDTFQGIVPGAFATMDFHVGGDGVSIGTFSNGPGFVVDMETTFQQEVEVYDNLGVNGNVVIPGNKVFKYGDNELTVYHLEQTANTNIVRLVPGAGNMTVTVPAVWG